MAPQRGTDAMYFIGVSTAGSSIMKLFPRWARTLGLNASIQGRDIPLGADRSVFRQVVDEIAATERCRGALVTTHKVSLYRHAAASFAEFDRLAHLCREVSCISKRDGALVGHAKDPITAGRALEHMLGKHYWTGHDGWLVCLGAGGAGTAITVHALTQPSPPQRIVVTDTDPRRIANLQTIHSEIGGSIGIDHHVVSGPPDTDSLLDSAPATSVVINATGLGKDAPGSPISDGARLPRGAVVWDLNYRGDLDFLRQAHAQAEARRLTVHDGWNYFLHGWSEHIAQIFHIDLTPALFEALAADARFLEPQHGH